MKYVLKTVLCTTMAFGLVFATAAPAQAAEVSRQAAQPQLNFDKNVTLSTTSWTTVTSDTPLLPPTLHIAQEGPSTMSVRFYNTKTGQYYQGGKVFEVYSGLSNYITIPIGNEFGSSAFRVEAKGYVAGTYRIAIDDLPFLR